MRKIKILTALVAFGVTLCSFSTSVSLDDTSKFDFLLGKWKLTWHDSLSGIKTVIKELDSVSIFEDYTDDQRTGTYKAKSYTVFHKYIKKYTQTMIDNQGNYTTFTGDWMEDKMILTTSYKTSDGKIQMYRQVYYNITAKSMDWKWEGSSDQGKTWKSELEIHYQKIN